MDAAAYGGLALAEQIAPIYATNPKFRAVLVGGSVARGDADEYSDLEIGVFWSEAPTDRERLDAIERLGGEVWTLHPYQSEPERLAIEHYGLREVVIDARRFMGTAMIDAKHFTVAGVERCLHDVLLRHDLSLDKQGLLSAIVHAVPLYGAPLLAQWRERASAYPDELACKVVRENLWLGPWFCPEAYAARDDVLVLHQHYLWLAQGLLKGLAGLNRIYYPTAEHKWMDRLIQDMLVAPHDLSSRLNQVFRDDLLTSWLELKALIDETLDLVEAHLPQVDRVPDSDLRPYVTLAWAKQRWSRHEPYTLMRAIGASRSPVEQTLTE